MNRYLFRFVANLKLRWKMVVVVLPLVILPLFLVGLVIGHIATRQAYRGITQTSKADLDHMASFTLDLLDAHYQQFEVYRQDKKRIINEELSTLVDFAYNLVEAQQRQYAAGQLSLTEAKRQAAEALKSGHVGESGYFYAMTSEGELTAHVAREGENVLDERDESGRYFLREMVQRAVAAEPGEVLFTIYPWRNVVLGDLRPRKKVVAYRYFPEWDWIIAVGGYLEETYEDLAFEQRSFANLKEKVKQKMVGRTGYIYCMDRQGTFTIHPEGEGQNFWDARDSDGNFFIREMAAKKQGWIRYPWKNTEDAEPRMKIVRYAYFAPWDWIVAVGSYEDEFYREADAIKWRIFLNMLFLPLVVGAVAVAMVFLATKVLTEPVNHMIAAIRRVKQGRYDARMQVDTDDELGELAAAFNRMLELIRRNREMEANLAQQNKMASLGVLSSGVAHEINNPLGVILGYAGYLEGKIPEGDPTHRFIREIKRESKRCKKIVQDLLSYARTPKPTLEAIDLNALLTQIVDFAANHTDLNGVAIVRRFAPQLPPLLLDGDQIRQVAINLMLNAGAAMPGGGRLEVATLREGEEVLIRFRDDGAGIADEELEKIFEPFYTTKARGTGLGLAITRQIVEQHQGRIDIGSRLGEGTTVNVRLPINQESF